MSKSRVFMIVEMHRVGLNKSYRMVKVDVVIWMKFARLIKTDDQAYQLQNIQHYFLYVNMFWRRIFPLLKKAIAETM